MENDFFLSHLCVSAQLWAGRPIQEVAMSMMRLGLVHLELSAQPGSQCHYQPDGNNSRLFNILAEAGVSVAVLRLSGMDFKQKIRAIHEAGDRGIPVVVDHAEKLNYPDLLVRLRAYSNLALQSRLRFVLENNVYSSCNDAESLGLVHRSLRHPALGLGFAPVHAVAEQKKPEQEVEALGSALRVAYLWDASPTMRAGTTMEEFYIGSPDDQTPGTLTGSVNWKAYFAALARIDFRGIFVLKWLGSPSWDAPRTEQAIIDSIAFCTRTAGETALGKTGQSASPAERLDHPNAEAS